MNRHYPHPIIAREGWPFLTIAIAVAIASSAFLPGFWPVLFWIVAASVMQFSPTSPPRRNLALHSQRDPPKYIIAIFFTKLNTFPQSAKYFGLNSRNFLQLLLPGSERRKKRFPKLLRESSVSVSGRITTR
jgi:hypothetical protein